MEICVLICDDEISICEGIAAAIRPLSGVNVTIATSGEQALELLCSVQFDTVFLDIQLPGISGLEVLRRIREELGLDVIVTILSGYDEFDYAQQAIKYDCHDYLLKPATSKKIQDYMRGISEVIQRKRDLQREVKILQKDIQTLRPILKERLFFSLMDNLTPKTDIAEYCHMLGIDVEWGFWGVALLQEQQKKRFLSEEAHQMYLYALAKRIEKEAGQRGRCEMFPVSSSLFALVFGCRDRKEYFATCDWLEETIEQLTMDNCFKLNAGVGGMVDDIASLPISYNQAFQTIAQLQNHQFVNVVYFEECGDETRQERYLREFEHFAGRLNTQNYSEVLDQFCGRCLAWLSDEKNADPETILIICSMLINQGLALLEKADVSFVNYYKALGYNPIRVLASKRTPEEMIQFGREELTHIMEHIILSANNKSVRTIEAAKKYIQTAYAENIDLELLAGKTGLSKNYFGQLFKSITGMSVAEYINLTRIERAKNLLVSTNQKVYEISDAVGYNDSFYFSAVFKKYIGVSPKDYRQFQGNLQLP